MSNQTFIKDAIVFVCAEEHEFHGQQGVVTKANKATSWVLLDGTEEPVKIRNEDLALDEQDESTGMAKTLANYRERYVVSISASGRKSKACGDEVSQLLEGLSHLQVAQVADCVMGESTGFHYAKYEHLNNGQIRMNSGNRVRAAIKRGDATTEDLEAILKSLSLK